MPHACYVCNFSPVPDGDGVECPHCHRMQYGAPCPNCRQSAPTVVRGLKVYCTSCNTLRGPLAGGLPLNIVGQSQRIGGTVTRVAGYVVIIVAVMAMLAVGFGGSMLFAMLGIESILPWIAGSGIGFLGTLAGLLMLFGGSKLKAAGQADVARTREQAIFALASHRGGMVTATDVGSALNIPVKEADAMLTEMAKEATRVGVEVDAQGVVHYVFREVRPKLDPSPAPGTGIRVDPSAPPTLGANNTNDAVKTKVDLEWQQLQQLQQRQREGR